MKSKTLGIILSVLIFLTLYSCQNVNQIEDGFKVHGIVRDSSINAVVPNTIVTVGYLVNDSISLSHRKFITDSLGNFTFAGGPGTAPSDEILYFEHEDYFSSSVILSQSVIRNNSQYSVTVLLKHK